MLTTTLALSDNWLVSIFLAQMAFNVGLFLVSFAAKRGTDRIDGLETEVKKHAEDAVEQKFKVVREELRGEIRLIAQDVKRANERLKSGDRLLGELRERDHQDELKTLTAIEQLRRDVIERMATKTELGKVQDAQQKLATKVAQIQGAA